MNEEEVLLHLKKAEERHLMRAQILRTALGPRGGITESEVFELQAQLTVVEQELASAIALRELWVDRPDTGTGAAKGQQRRPM